MIITEISRKGEEADVTIMQNRQQATFTVIVIWKNFHLFKFNHYVFKVKCGTNIDPKMASEFVNTGYHDNMLAEMMLSHKVHDLCIVGPRVGADRVYDT